MYFIDNFTLQGKDFDRRLFVLKNKVNVEQNNI